MKKSTVILLSSVMLLLGTVLGFLLAPIKKGVNVTVKNTGIRDLDSSGEDDLQYTDEDDLPF